MTQYLIPCTACRYCIDDCPMQIAIPDLFACLNAKICENVCPQHLKIRNLLVDVVEEFEMAR